MDQNEVGEALEDSMKVFYDTSCIESIVWARAAVANNNTNNNTR